MSRALISDVDILGLLSGGYGRVGDDGDEELVASALNDVDILGEEGQASLAARLRAARGIDRNAVAVREQLLSNMGPLRLKTSM
jgi:hypothetical protein